MPRDLSRLLHDTAVRPVEEPDVAGLVQRGRRRRRRRHVGTGLGAAAVTLLAVVVAHVVGTGAPTTPEIVDQPATSPTATPSVSDTSSATDAPSTSAAAQLTPEQFPAMGPHGVAVDTGDGVVFIDLQGQLQGRLSGWELATGGPDEDFAGPVSLLDRDANRRAWAAPASGTLQLQDDASDLWAPLAGGHRIASPDLWTDPAPLELLAPDGSATTLPHLGVFLSAGHRVVNWVDCPPDAPPGVAGACTWQAFDTDMVGEVDLPDGCRVADALGDHTHLLACARWWDGADGVAWLERRGPSGPARVEALGPDGTYANAFLAVGGIHATWRGPADDGCATWQAVSAAGDGQLRPIATAGNGARGSMVLGVPETHPVLAEWDTTCRGDDGVGRVLRLRPDGARMVLYEGPLVRAELWDPTATLPGDGGLEPSQSPAEAERDGVPPQIAALPFDQRVDVVEPVRAFFDVRVATDDGVWVASRLPIESRDGQHGDYGEVLLLDPNEEQILRALPLPGLPPQRLAVHGDAVWCARQGDGALPDGMLCRIGTKAPDGRVRVFPHRTGTVPDATEVPDHWAVEDGPVRYAQEYLAGRWSFEGDTLVASAQGALRYDPATLAPIPPCPLDAATRATRDGDVVRLTTTIAQADGQPACGFDPVVGYELLDADGWPLGVDGLRGGETRRIIEPGAPVQVTAEWRNWCEDRPPARVVFHAGPFGQHATPLDVAPPCTDPGAPSRLELR